jgi:hypothetical protein
MNASLCFIFFFFCCQSAASLDIQKTSRSLLQPSILKLRMPSIQDQKCFLAPPHALCLRLQNFLQNFQDTKGETSSLNTVTNYKTTLVGADYMCGRYVSQLSFKNEQKISRMSRDLAE